MGNGNVVTARTEGNGINGNQIRRYNCRGDGHYASNYTVRPRKLDAAYLQQQLQISLEEEAGIQSTQKELKFMADADAYDKTERVTVNCTSDDTLQQASTSGTQSDNAPVYDSDGSAEYTDLQTELDRMIEKLENYIIKKEKEYAVLWNNWYTKCEECKYDKISSDTQCASNTLDPVSQKLEDENTSLEFQVRNYAKENEHLKTTYKNLFDSIKVTQAQTKSIIDSLQKQLHNTIYENAKLRAQLFDKVSERKDTTKGTSYDIFVTIAINLGKPPSSSSSGSKLYYVTPFPKSSVLPKVDKTNALSKPVTSNSAPSTRELKVVQIVNVIAPRIFRPNPSKTSRFNSDSNGFSTTKVNNTAKTRRPHPRSNSNTDRVQSKSKSITANHDVCVLNYVNNMNSRANNQSANVLKRENQKKHKANVKKSKELGPKGSLVSSRPSSPRSCLRWSPTGRIFDLKGKIIESSESDGQSDISVCDNASTSNPSEPSSKGFRNSTSFLGSNQLKVNWIYCSKLCIMIILVVNRQLLSSTEESVLLLHIAVLFKSSDSNMASINSRLVTAPDSTNSSSQLQIIPNTSWNVASLKNITQQMFAATDVADYAGCNDTFRVPFGGAQLLGESCPLDADTFIGYRFQFNTNSYLCDSKLAIAKSAIAISCNPVQHSRTKHIDVRYHFIKEHVEKASIELYLVKLDYQLVSLFTKALPVDRFNYLVRRLGMRSFSPQELERLAKSQ
ncbi:hypothetical protein Tco_0894211 [Tanacetum coccineum]|uniref:Retrovirus-related Pol polyprotein from transposon TNT 1-94 n=1 Tax=Tanacetum coccineum TaxID=301880 RepID=A0ABQ5CCE8_9ASTR